MWGVRCTTCMLFIYIITNNEISGEYIVIRCLYAQTANLSYMLFFCSLVSSLESKTRMIFLFHYFPQSHTYNIRHAHTCQVYSRFRFVLYGTYAFCYHIRAHVTFQAISQCLPQSIQRTFFSQPSSNVCRITNYQLSKYNFG